MYTWLLILACILTWGIAAFLMKIAGQGLDATTAVIFTLPGYLLLAACLAHKADYSLWKQGWGPISVGVLYGLGNLAFYKLCHTQEISRLAPITALYVVIPVGLGCLVLREPVTLQKALGILLAVVALYLLNLSDKPADPVRRPVSSTETGSDPAALKIEKSAIGDNPA